MSNDKLAAAFYPAPIPAPKVATAITPNRRPLNPLALLAIIAGGLTVGVAILGAIIILYI